VDKKSGKIVVKMGILLVTPRRETKDTKYFRLSILWQAETKTLKKGSAMFGRLLRITSDFQQWRTMKVSLLDFEY
jgi:hypothetical protein